MPGRLVSAALALAVAAALGVAGCGSQTKDSSKNFTGDQQQVAKVIESLEKASAGRRKPDGKEICTKLITSDLAKKISSQDPNKNCDQRVNDSLDDRNDAGGIATLDVKKVTIAGDKAVASVKAKAGDDEQTTDYSLVRSGNGWLISSF